jgi:hypothetical protein
MQNKLKKELHRKPALEEKKITYAMRRFRFGGR